MKEKTNQANESQKEMKNIVEAGNYDKVKFLTDSATESGDVLLAICSRGGRDYLINYRGGIIEEVFEADELRPNLGSITPAAFRVGDKWGMVNSRGEVFLEAKYDSVKPDVNEYIFLRLNGKEGFIAGGHIIEPRFDSITVAADDYLEVTLNGVKGYVDENDEFTTDRAEAYYNIMMFI